MIKKLLRILYGLFSYAVFILLIFALILNIIALIVNLSIDNDFTVSVWECAFLPLVIYFTIKYYPRCLNQSNKLLHKRRT